MTNAGRAGVGRRLALGLALALLSGGAGCSESNMEELGREAAEKAKSSIRAVDADAHEQKIPVEVVKKVQQDLAAIHEYMGPIDGRLDAVTLNAFEAFQRAEGMHPDGMLEDKTVARLSAAAAKARGPAS